MENKEEQNELGSGPGMQDLEDLEGMQAQHSLGWMAEQSQAEEETYENEAEQASSVASSHPFGAWEGIESESSLDQAYGPPDQELALLQGITKTHRNHLFKAGITSISKLLNTTIDEIRANLSPTARVTEANIAEWKAQATELVARMMAPGQQGSVGSGAGGSGAGGGGGGGGAGGAGAGGAGAGGAGAGGGDAGGAGGGGAGAGGAGAGGNGGGRLSEEWLIRDMMLRNEDAYDTLQARADELDRRKRDTNGILEEELEQELAAADAILAQRDRKLVIDPLYKEVQKKLSAVGIPDHREGKFPVPFVEPWRSRAIEFLAIYGIMLRENQTQPIFGQRVPDARLIVLEIKEAIDTGQPVNARQKRVYDTLEAQKYPWNDVRNSVRRPAQTQRFANALALSQAEVERNRRLYESVLAGLLDRGINPPSLSAEDWARVAGTLAKDNVSPTDPYLGLKALTILQGQVRGGAAGGVAGGAGGGFLDGVDISLPDLEEQVDHEIIYDNVNAMQAVYYAAMLEDLKFFQVRDKVMDSFRMGLTPFGRGPAGRLIYEMLRANPNRLSEYDRRNIYARTLGMPGGDASGPINRDFQSLWLRFISSVSSFARQLTVDYLLRSNIPVRVHQEAVKKSARDLAANLSLFGYGITFFAAVELRDQISEGIKLLNDNEVKGSYGSRDMWGVIDQVAALELGGARDSVRYRTMATSGAIIIKWLANKSSLLAKAEAGDLIDLNEIYRPRVRPAGTKSLDTPFDSDLVNACERWLAVTGTLDAQVETYAQPVESPVITAQPIPSFARDMLQSAGVNGFGLR